MTMYRYAVFSAHGACRSIISSMVPLRLPDRLMGVLSGAAPADLYQDGDGHIRHRVDVAPTIARRRLVCDGVDRIDVAGLPSDARLIVDGKRLPAGAGITAETPGEIVVEIAPPYRAAPIIIEAGTLDAFASDLLTDIDRAAEAARARHGLVMAGQQETYRAKEREARAVVGGLAGPADSPFLSAEAAARGVTLAELAGAVIAKADAWAAASAAIEALRSGAKAGIAAATGIEAMEAAAAVNWPAPTESEGNEQ